MPVSYWLVLLPLLLSLSAPGACGAGKAGRDLATGDDEKRILVTFPLGPPTPLQRPGNTPKASYFPESAYRDSLFDRALVRALTEDYAMREVSQWPIRTLGVFCVVFEAGEETAVEPLITRLRRDPRVESVQKMNRFYVRSRSGPDPYRKLQYGMDSMGVGEAHRWATGRGVRIAVVDTGIDIDHPDLAGRVPIKEDFTGGQDEAFRRDIHGTAVAGVISAVQGNGEGIVGVSPKAEIMALKACWPIAGDSRRQAACNSFTLAKAISYAIENHADIINLSLAGPEDDLLRRLIKAAIGENTIIVGAYGGCNGFPGSVGGVITAASFEGPDESAPACPVAHRAPVYAPGVDVITTLPGGRYDFVSGHSLAAAHVTGVVALLLEHRSLSSQDLRKMLAPPLDGIKPAGNIARPLSACIILARLLEKKGCDTKKRTLSGHFPALALTKFELRKL